MADMTSVNSILKETKAKRRVSQIASLLIKSGDPVGTAQSKAGTMVKPRLESFTNKTLNKRGTP